tara:strand:- start:1177 stop:2280 length:1104 start_codon:yes stop_codon:yes gene_type:complete
MAIYKRGDIWHFDFTVRGERHRGSTGFRKKADASQYVENLRRDLKLGTSPERAPVTLGQAADQWFASRVVGKKTATTTAIRLGILFRHIDRNLPVRSIGAREVEASIIARSVEPTRQGGLPKPSTINRDMIDTTLRPVLSYAAEAMEEQSRPIKWAKLRRQESAGRTRTFTDAEITGWRDGLPEWHRPPFNFILRYGVRLGEAFFPPRAVDVEAGTITLYDTKNGTDHTLHILDEDLPDIAARKTRAEAAGLETIWFRDDGGELTPIHWRGFQSASRSALDAAGIQDARPVHDLRHHAATTLLRGCNNLIIVKAQLNHKTIASTARYAHANGEDVKEALRHTYGTKSAPKTKKNSRINAKRGRGSVT